MPLATDALIGDHLARIVAETPRCVPRADAARRLLGHHLGFAGTLSLNEQTFHSVIAELCGRSSRGVSWRIVLLPTHGGNFGPLAAALAKLEDSERDRVVALTDLGLLFEIARIGEQRVRGAPR